MIDFTQDAKTIAGQFMRITNNYSFDYKGLAEELKNSKEMKQLSLHWLAILKSPNYRTDDRNAIAARKGQEISEILFLKKKLENLKDDMKIVKICMEISCDHRTLQQTFSGFVFYYILITATEKQREQLINRFGETFYRLPLI